MRPNISKIINSVLKNLSHTFYLNERSCYKEFKIVLRKVWFIFFILGILLVVVFFIELFANLQLLNVKYLKNGCLMSPAIKDACPLTRTVEVYCIYWWYVCELLYISPWGFYTNILPYLYIQYINVNNCIKRVSKQVRL